MSKRTKPGPDASEAAANDRDAAAQHLLDLVEARASVLGHLKIPPPPPEPLDG